MKTIPQALFYAALLLPLITFFSCVSVPPADPPAANLFACQNEPIFSDVEGKEWLLFEIRRSGEVVRIDRQALDAYGFGVIYTITFEDGSVSGMGAPNRFFGPFTVDSDKSLSIGLLAHTMMLALFEPDGLNEHEYFTYLSRVTRWNVREGKLELYTSGDDGSETVFVFALDS